MKQKGVEKMIPTSGKRRNIMKAAKEIKMKYFILTNEFGYMVCHFSRGTSRSKSLGFI